MRGGVWIAVVAAAALLGGCGRGGDEAAQGPGAKASGEASAEQVAKAARGKLRCPAKVATARPAGAPVDDVVGVRPGMTWDEAANTVMCDHPLLVVTEVKDRGFDINTYGAAVRQAFVAKFAEPRVEKTSEEIVKEMQDDAMRRGMNTYVAPLKPGQSRYFVSTMGLPGAERVVTVAREEYFPQGKLPSLASVKQALVAKYGPPSQAEDNGGHAYLWWEYDPNGRPVTETSPLYTACRITVSPDAPTSLSPDCGVTVGALIQGASDNPGLAHSLAVTSQDGARGYALITATEQALMQGDQTRQSREVDAAKGAAAPKL
jgi:hypothetical protein